ncbi:hypothetical protein HanHA300_Chr08g0285541 [Helianthus annuus]|nr:hypothetical protein HanHA300_Chr08g0285541 [Helianthus annuus]
MFLGFNHLPRHFSSYDAHLEILHLKFTCVLFVDHQCMFDFIFLHRYEQLIEHTKGLSGRTYKLVSQLMEHGQAQAAR